MRLDFTDERVLAVVAHPDDTELLYAGTLARASRDGAEIAICVLCAGDKGQPADSIENLAEIRKEEMTAAAKSARRVAFLRRHSRRRVAGRIRATTAAH